MKSLLTLLLFSLSVWTAGADGTPYAPASQAEVNAGVNGFKAVTPKTLSGGIAANLPGNVVTNGNQLGILPTFTATTFNQSNHIYFYTGHSPTNLTLQTQFDDNPAFDVRDPSIFKYTDNNGNSTYLCSYGRYNTGQAITNHVGVATLVNGAWVFYGEMNFGRACQWSGKFGVNSTNGLFMTVALSGATGVAPTNPFVCDIAPNNFTNWSGLRALQTSTNTILPGPEQSAGIIIYNSPWYFYFDTVGREFTNSTLTTNGWNYCQTDIAQNWGNAGPSVFWFGNRWYWFTSDALLSYITSPDLIQWTGTNGQPVFNSPYAFGTLVTNAWNEGTFLLEQYATTSPYQNTSNSWRGTFSGNGFGLTNLNASSLSSGTVPMGRLALGQTNSSAGSSFYVTDGANRWTTQDGSGLTNLNGAAIQAGTVTSNNIISVNAGQIQGQLSQAQLPSQFSALTVNGAIVSTNTATLMADSGTGRFSSVTAGGSYSSLSFDTNGIFTIYGANSRADALETGGGGAGRSFVNVGKTGNVYIGTYTYNSPDPGIRFSIQTNAFTVSDSGNVTASGAGSFKSINSQGFGATLGDTTCGAMAASGVVSVKTNSTIQAGVIGKAVFSFVTGTNWTVMDIGGGAFFTNHVP